MTENVEEVTFSALPGLRSLGVLRVRLLKTNGLYQQAIVTLDIIGWRTKCDKFEVLLKKETAQTGYDPT